MKDFLKKAALFPASVLGFIAAVVFGQDVEKKNAQGENVTVHRPGIIGALARLVSYVSTGFGNLINNHKTAIATAFWASLVLAGAAALTVFLWPAALTAVATFSIYGISIASVVGANALAQVGAVAAVAAAATSVAVYVAATLVNGFNAIKNALTSRPAVAPTATKAVEIPVVEDKKVETKAEVKEVKADVNPTHHQSPLAAPRVVVEPAPAPAVAPTPAPGV